MIQNLFLNKSKYSKPSAYNCFDTSKLPINENDRHIQAVKLIKEQLSTSANEDFFYKKKIILKEKFYFETSTYDSVEMSAFISKNEYNSIISTLSKLAGQEWLIRRELKYTINPLNQTLIFLSKFILLIVGLILVKNTTDESKISIAFEDNKLDLNKIKDQYKKGSYGTAFFVGMFTIICHIIGISLTLGFVYFKKPPVELTTFARVNLVLKAKIKEINDVFIEEKRRVRFEFNESKQELNFYLISDVQTESQLKS